MLTLLVLSVDGAADIGWSRFSGDPDRAYFALAFVNRFQLKDMDLPRLSILVKPMLGVSLLLLLDDVLCSRSLLLSTTSSDACALARVPTFLLTRFRCKLATLIDDILRSGNWAGALLSSFRLLAYLEALPLSRSSLSGTDFFFLFATLVVADAVEPSTGGHRMDDVESASCHCCLDKGAALVVSMSGWKLIESFLRSSLGDPGFELSV